MFNRIATLVPNVTYTTISRASSNSTDRSISVQSYLSEIKAIWADFGYDDGIEVRKIIRDTYICVTLLGDEIDITYFWVSQ